MKKLIVACVLMVGCVTAKPKDSQSREVVIFSNVPREKNHVYACMYPDSPDALVCMDFYYFASRLKEAP